MTERLKKDPAVEPGAIVNIIGMGGKIASDIHIAGGAANAALMLNTVGLAHHYAKLGIRINAINPGATLTERVEEAAHARGATPGRDARSGARRQSGQGAARTLCEAGRNRGWRALSREPPRELCVGRAHPDGRRVVADHLMRFGPEAIRGRRHERTLTESGGRATSRPPPAQRTPESSESTPTRYCPRRPSAPR